MNIVGNNCLNFDLQKRIGIRYGGDAKRYCAEVKKFK